MTPHGLTGKAYRDTFIVIAIGLVMIVVAVWIL